MKTIITAEDLRDIYGEYCADNRITDAPEAEELTADQLDEMFEDFEQRSENSLMMPYRIAVNVIEDWLFTWSEARDR